MDRESCTVAFDQSDFTFLYNSENVALHQHVGKGLALLELSISPFSSTTGTLAQLQHDVIQTKLAIDAEKKIQLAAQSLPSGWLSDPPPPPPSSDSAMLHVCIFPAIPTPIQPLVEFIRERLDQALVSYALERLCEAMDGGGPDSERVVLQESRPSSNSSNSTYLSGSDFLRLQHKLLSTLKAGSASYHGMHMFPLKVGKTSAQNVLRQISATTLETLPSLHDYERAYGCVPIFPNPIRVRSEGDRRGYDTTDWCHVSSDLAEGREFNDSNKMNAYYGGTDFNRNRYKPNLSTPSSSSFTSMVDPRHLLDCEDFTRSISFVRQHKMTRRKFFLEVAVDVSGIHLFFFNISAKHIERIVGNILRIAAIAVVESNSADIKYLATTRLLSPSSHHSALVSKNLENLGNYELYRLFDDMLHRMVVLVFR